MVHMRCKPYVELLKHSPEPTPRLPLPPYTHPHHPHPHTHTPRPNTCSSDGFRVLLAAHRFASSHVSCRHNVIGVQEGCQARAPQIPGDLGGGACARSKTRSQITDHSLELEISERACASITSGRRGGESCNHAVILTKGRADRGACFQQLATHTAPSKYCPAHSLLHPHA